MKKIILIVCLFTSFGFLYAQNDDQYYNPNESNDAFARGEVPGYMNNNVPPIWIDDPDYALLERHERVCDRCKSGRRCKYQDEVTQRLAIKYGYGDSQAYAYPSGVTPVFTQSQLYNPNIVVGGASPFFVSNNCGRGGAYTISGGYYDNGAYGGNYHRQNNRNYGQGRGLNWNAGLVLQIGN